MQAPWRRAPIPTVNARDSEGKTPLAASIDENEMAGADISCVYSALLRAGAHARRMYQTMKGTRRIRTRKVDAPAASRNTRHKSRSLADIFEPKFPKLPAEVIRTIVAFWARGGGLLAHGLYIPAVPQPKTSTRFTALQFAMMIDGPLAFER